MITFPACPKVGKSYLLRHFAIGSIWDGCADFIPREAAYITSTMGEARRVWKAMKHGIRSPYLEYRRNPLEVVCANGGVLRFFAGKES